METVPKIQEIKKTEASQPNLPGLSKEATAWRPEIQQRIAEKAVKLGVSDTEALRLITEEDSKDHLEDSSYLRRSR